MQWEDIVEIGIITYRDKGDLSPCPGADDAVKAAESIMDNYYDEKQEKKMEYGVIFDESKNKWIIKGWLVGTTGEVQFDAVSAIRTGKHIFTSHTHDDDYGDDVYNETGTVVSIWDIGYFGRADRDFEFTYVRHRNITYRFNTGELKNNTDFSGAPGKKGLLTKLNEYLTNSDTHDKPSATDISSIIKPIYRSC